MKGAYFSISYCIAYHQTTVLCGRLVLLGIELFLNTPDTTVLGISIAYVKLGEYLVLSTATIPRIVIRLTGAWMHTLCMYCTTSVPRCVWSVGGTDFGLTT
jgi:hypothetical protein